MQPKKPNTPVGRRNPVVERKPVMVKKYFVADSVKGISIGSQYFTRGQEVTAPVPSFFLEHGQVVRKLVPKK